MSVSLFNVEIAVSKLKEMSVFVFKFGLNKSIERIVIGFENFLEENVIGLQVTTI